eukprot:6491256-Amphidinium_carterae.3
MSEDQLHAKLRAATELMKRMAPSYLATAASVEEKEGILAEVVTSTELLSDMASALDTSGLKTHHSDEYYLHSNADLLMAIMTADNLRNQGGLKANLRNAIWLAAPPLLRQALVKLLDDKLAPPSRWTVQRGRFLLDLALALVVRAELSPEGRATRPLLYAWSDSSPQATRNWFLSQVHMFRPESMSDFFVAWCCMQERASSNTCNVDSDAEIETESTDTVQLEEDDGAGTQLTLLPQYDRKVHLTKVPESGNDVTHLGFNRPFHGFTFLIQVSRLKILEVCRVVHVLHHQALIVKVQLSRRAIVQAWKYHVLVPTALGSGNEKMENKASCFLHALRQEVPDNDALDEILSSSIVSCTSDMGTELHLAQCTVDERNPCHHACTPYLAPYLREVILEDTVSWSLTWFTSGTFVPRPEAKRGLLAIGNVLRVKITSLQLRDAKTG